VTIILKNSNKTLSAACAVVLLYSAFQSFFIKHMCLYFIIILCCWNYVLCQYSSLWGTMSWPRGWIGCGSAPSTTWPPKWRPCAVLVLKIWYFNCWYGSPKKWRQFAKFHAHRSSHCWDMAFFDLVFKMADICNLRFIIRIFGLFTKGIWWSLLNCKIWLESVQWFR